MKDKGIYKRDETLMRAQQDYDVFAFIANRPLPKNMVNIEYPEELVRDKLVRYPKMKAPKERMEPNSLKYIRPVIKLMIKGAITIPVVMLYLAPKKIAQLAVAIIYKATKLSPAIMKNLIHAIQSQYQNIQPHIVKVQKAMQKVVEKLKTTVSNVAQPFNQARKYVQQQAMKPIAQAFKIVQNNLYKLLGIKLPFGKMQIETKLAKPLLKRAMDMLANSFGKVKDKITQKAKEIYQDIKTEVMDVFNFAQKIVQPIVKFAKNIIQPLKNLPNTIKQQFNNLVLKARENFRERFLDPVKKKAEQVKVFINEVVQQAQQVKEAIVATIQQWAVPVINLYASTIQFLRNQREKLGLNISAWMKKTGEGFTKFTSQFSSLFTKGGLKAVAQMLASWMAPSKMLALHRWLTELMARAAVWLEAGLEAFARWAKQKLVQAAGLSKVIAKLVWQGVCYGLWPLIKEMAMAFRWIIEWAFGRPGALFIEGLKIASMGIYRSFRFVGSICREVYGEIIRWSETA